MKFIESLRARALGVRASESAWQGEELRSAFEGNL